MKIAEILKIILIIILPFLIVISAAKFAAFDTDFYEKKFAEYGVKDKIPEAWTLHQSVMDFIKGKSNFLPDSFNEREIRHLEEVRLTILKLRILFYISAIIFGILLLFSVIMIKEKGKILAFAGNVLFFGGISAIAIGIVLLLFVSLDFSSSFESFHKLLFTKGTYSFDPETEIIVSVYPEQLFMDLGIRILKISLLLSSAFALGGAFMLYRIKKNK